MHLFMLFKFSDIFKVGKGTLYWELRTNFGGTGTITKSINIKHRPMSLVFIKYTSPCFTYKIDRRETKFEPFYTWRFVPYTLEQLSQY